MEVFLEGSFEYLPEQLRNTIVCSIVSINATRSYFVRRLLSRKKLSNQVVSLIDLQWSAIDVPGRTIHFSNTIRCSLISRFAARSTVFVPNETSKTSILRFWWSLRSLLAKNAIRVYRSVQPSICSFNCVRTECTRIMCYEGNGTRNRRG